MDLSIYLSELQDYFLDRDNWKKNTLGNTITRYNSDIKLQDYDIAILGVQESRGSEEPYDNELSTSTTRSSYYPLFNHFPNVKVLDMGDILGGNKVSDSYFAVTNVVQELIKKEVIPIVIGSSQDVTYAKYLAYEGLEQSVNIATVDPKIDIGIIEDEINDSNYINQIVMHQPNYLFNYSNIGYQSYLSDDELVSLLEKLNFDS